MSAAARHAPTFPARSDGPTAHPKRTHSSKGADSMAAAPSPAGMREGAAPAATGRAFASCRHLFDGARVQSLQEAARLLRIEARIARLDAEEESILARSREA